MDYTTIAINDERYPALLREIHRPPRQLYIRGVLHPHETNMLAIVGTRKMSVYGKRCTEALVPPVASAGIVVVSGLALGIDGAAHAACLEAGGRTIAVLGGGIDDDSIYPRAHRGLAQKILTNGGALISEYPPGTDPLSGHFPERNRIIAGMSRGTVVIEAAFDSGSLITAKIALDFGREVFAVPGQIFSETAQGVNQALKLGAHVVTEASDILSVFGIHEAHTRKEVKPASPEEAMVLAALTSEPTHLDTLAETTGMPSARLGSTLTMMELVGKVRHLGNLYYVRA